LPNFLAVNVCRVNHYEVVLRNFLGANFYMVNTHAVVLRTFLVQISTRKIIMQLSCVLFSVPISTG
jgi:hypothetical protein